MTTTDPFTEAAREEAHAFWMGTLQDDTVGVRDLGEHIARWARDRLTTQKVTEEQLAAAYAEKGRHVAYSVVPGEFRCFCGAPGHWGSTAGHEQHALWHALSAAGIQPTLEQRIRDLHTPDADGNCAHCTRGRVYPVPAPCETVRALAGGGEVR